MEDLNGIWEAQAYLFFVEKKGKKIYLYASSGEKKEKEFPNSEPS